MTRIAWIVAATVLVAGQAAAQETRGTIQGTVKDPQGGVVAAAIVVVTNADTNVPVSAKTDTVGVFRVPLLLPGNYSVSVEASGFKKAVRTGIVLQLSDVRDVEITLAVGAVTEQVSVIAEAPLVDAARTDAGATLEERAVQDLPVMTNTVFTMIRYAPGVQAGGPPILLGPHSTQGGSDYNNGTGVGGNSWTLDGASNNGNARFTANLPSVESVSETKVLTNTFDGDFGHSTGLGIAVSTKTGTNALHGTLSENYWNQRWQSTDLWTKSNYYATIAADNAKGNPAQAAADAAKPIQPAGHSNLYSATITGPLVIPKVFNGRNKVFFSFFYNAERDVKPEAAFTYPHVVPTPANKKGDFSDLLQVAISPQNYQLYDPLSVRADPARAGHFLRTAIPGNILPANYVGMGSKIYNNYAKYWPDPNNWFDHSTTPNNNPYLAIDTPYNWIYDQYAGRMDANVTSKLRIFGRYTQNHFVEYRSDWTIDIVRGFNNTGPQGSGVWRDDQNGVLDAVYTLGARTIIHANVGVTNWSSQSTVLDYPFQFKPSTVGLPTYLDDKCALTRCYIPFMNITGYAQNGINGYPAPVYNRFITQYGDVYHNIGRHALHFGAEHRTQVRSIHASNNDGSYTFGNTFFRQCDDACASGTYSAGGIGLSWASFMMGLPTGITISNNDSAIVQNPFYGFFAQDTWRVTPRLTLTLSLRGEWEQGATERFNRYIIGFDPAATLPVTAAAQSAYSASPIAELPAGQFKALGGPIYAGTPGAPGHAWASQLMWLPRVGFGYQLNNKTVIRGGYGVYYDTLDVNAISFGPNQTGYSLNTNTTVANDGQGVSWNPLLPSPSGLQSPLLDPFPVRPTAGNTRFDAPVGNIYGNMALAGGSFTLPADRHPRQQRWRIGIERQLGSSNVVSAAYTGTWTSDLNINVNLSAVPASYYYFGNSRPTVSCSATVTAGCLQDSNMSAAVTNPFALGNFAALKTSNPALYSYMSTLGFFTSGTISKARLIGAYPLTNLTVPDPIGKARSQQGDVSFIHRFNHGLSASFTYTRMVAKQATGFFQPWGGIDPNNLAQVPLWTIGGAAPNKIAATWVYDLPFGKGRQWVHEKYLSMLVSDWSFSGTYDYQPGALLSWGNSFYYGDPNQIKLSNPTYGEWFNTAGCVASAAAAGPGDIVVPVGQPCTQGWEKRSGLTPGTYQWRTFPVQIGGLRGPGYQQWNGSVSRNIRFKERYTFNMRLDVLNVFNHSFPANPNQTPTNSQFGQITGAAANLNRFIQIQGHIRW
jgi:hypothetical protein